MTCICGHEHSAHELHATGRVGVCWVSYCDCQAFQPSALGGSGSESPDRVAPSARSTPAETTVAKPLEEPVATDESPARSRTACAAGSSLTWRDVRAAIDREIATWNSIGPDRQDSYRLGWLEYSVANFLNNHPEHRAELLPELDPETTETTW